MYPIDPQAKSPQNTEAPQTETPQGWLGRSWNLASAGLAHIGGLFRSTLSETAAPPKEKDCQKPKRSPGEQQALDAARLQELLKTPIPPLPEKQNPLSKALRKAHNEKMTGDISGLYLTTNEGRLDTIRLELGAKAPIEGACHVGFSGLHNFDIMAQRQSQHAVIIDFNPENRDFIHCALHCLRLSPTREEFVEAFDPYISHPTRAVNVNPNVREDKDFLDCSDELKAELERSGSWLGSEQSYAWIRHLALQDRIAAITEDVRATKTCERIAELLRTNAGPIDTLYVSNIAKYMESEEDKAQFLASTQALTRPETSVITCLPASYRAMAQDPDAHLNQHLFSAQQLAETPDLYWKTRQGQ